MFGEKTLYSSTITGTGSYTLDAAVGSFKSWRSQFADLSTVFYYAENSDATIWEAGYGTLTYGSPDTISRTLISSSTGSLISWVAADAPIYVFSAPSATALKHMLAPLATTRPAWGPAGFAWFDYTLGLAVAWVKNRWTGSANIEEGRYDIAKGIFAPSPRRVWTATGTSGKTVAAADVGGVFTFNNSAAARTMTLPAHATTGIGHAFRVGGLGLTSGGHYGVVVTPDAGDGIEGGADGATKTIPGGVRFEVVWDEPSDMWRIEYLNTAQAWETGDYRISLRATTTLPGWVKANDGTLGNAASGGTARANADTAALFTFLYDNFSDALCPVSGGRTTNAATDYGLNKTITLSALMGRALVIAGTGSGLTARALGDKTGAETHDHTALTGTPDNTTPVTGGGGGAGGASHHHAITADTTMQPSSFVNVFIKL